MIRELTCRSDVSLRTITEKNIRDLSDVSIQMEGTISTRYNGGEKRGTGRRGETIDGEGPMRKKSPFISSYRLGWIRADCRFEESVFVFDRERRWQESLRVP